MHGPALSLNFRPKEEEGQLLWAPLTSGPAQESFLEAGASRLGQDGSSEYSEGPWHSDGPGWKVLLLSHRMEALVLLPLWQDPQL